MYPWHEPPRLAIAIVALLFALLVLATVIRHILALF